MEEINDLKDEVSALKAKEQKLMQEIKKRGDLARQLCSAKDEEIKQLREKLHFDQRHQSSSPVHRRKSFQHQDPHDSSESLSQSSKDENTLVEPQVVEDSTQSKLAMSTSHSHLSDISHPETNSLDFTEEEVSFIFLWPN